MLITLKRFVFNKILDLLPSSCFGYRRFILCLMNVKISSSAKVNAGFRVYGPGNVKIENDVWIGLNCKIYTAGFNSVSIGKNVEIGPETVFNCQSHEIGEASHRAGKCKMHNIEIGEGCWIGTRCTILCSKIGEGCVIGAASLVLDDVEKNSMAAGIPAAVKKGL